MKQKKKKTIMDRTVPSVSLLYCLTLHFRNTSLGVFCLAKVPKGVLHSTFFYFLEILKVNGRSPYLSLIALYTQHRQYSYLA